MREVLRDLRDLERAPHGAPMPPDLMAIQVRLDLLSNNVGMGSVWCLQATFL